MKSKKTKIFISSDSLKSCISSRKKSFIYKARDDGLFKRTIYFKINIGKRKAEIIEFPKHFNKNCL